MKHGSNFRLVYKTRCSHKTWTCANSVSKSTTSLPTGACALPRWWNGTHVIGNFPFAAESVTEIRALKMGSIEGTASIEESHSTSVFSRDCWKKTDGTHTSRGFYYFETIPIRLWGHSKRDGLSSTKVLPNATCMFGQWSIASAV